MKRIELQFRGSNNRQKPEGMRVVRSIASLLIVAAVVTGCSGNDNHFGAGAENGAAHDDEDDQPEPSGRKLLEYPSPSAWQHATERQRQRAERSFEQLRKRDVPVYHGPLMVNDDEEVQLQTAQDAARRTLVLWAVVLRSEGMPQEETLGLIERLDLWDSVSAEEKRFLHDDEPDAEECRRREWRLESIWVLLWALGYLDELDWPSEMCDVPKLAKILEPEESNPNFIAGARLRSAAEILDAQDRVMRIHWAIRDALLHRGGMIPENLDWSQDGEWIPVTLSAAVGIVEEWHYTLNWLVKYLDPRDWDHVDTPT